MRIPREIVDQVREKVDLVQIVSRHVALKPRGREHLGLCPFHQEKTPSFHVIPHKGWYHCFGCQASGDAFAFVMQMEGLSFNEAVRELGASVGVEVEERQLTPEEKRAAKLRASAFDVLEAANAAFQAWLWTGPGGAVARDYLAGRGVRVDFARQEQLGWAPNEWSALLDRLHREGFSPEQAVAAGIAKARESGGGAYDVLRGRVTLPIRDERGRVIAFGGRALVSDPNVPKYLNTPETALYKKSNVLYGFDRARMAIQKKGRALVVEGNFDVLSLHQAGFLEAVATCGTALTAQHLEKLRRNTREVVLVMDADAAGLRAAEKALPLFVEAGLQPWRITLPEGFKDPDELVRSEGGAERLEDALARKEPLFEWVALRKLDAAGHSAMGRDRALEEVLPMLARLRDPTLNSRVARRLGVPEEVVIERIRGHVPAARTAPVEAAPDPVPDPPERLRVTVDQTHLLWLLVHRYEEVADLVGRIGVAALEPEPRLRTVLGRLQKGEPVAGVLRDLEFDPTVQRVVGAVVARQELYPPERAALALCQVAGRLLRPEHTRRLARARDAYEAAARSGDVDGSLRLLRGLKTLQDLDKALEKALRESDVPRSAAALEALGRPG